jgi:hypothetical protein
VLQVLKQQQWQHQQHCVSAYVSEKFTLRGHLPALQTATPARRQTPYTSACQVALPLQSIYHTPTRYTFWIHIVWRLEVGSPHS